MICPYCSHDNIAGVDSCAECGQSLIGVSDNDSELVDSISRHPVDALNPRAPAAVAPTTTLREAIEAMVGQHIGCLLVVDGETLVGIVTERDFLNKAAGDDGKLDQPVVDFMTESPETIIGQDSIAYALHAMDLGGYRHMPIVDETGRPTGIISVRDILRFLCAKFANTPIAD